MTVLRPKVAWKKFEETTSGCSFHLVRTQEMMTQGAFLMPTSLQTQDFWIKSLGGGKQWDLGKQTKLATNLKVCCAWRA